jgi:hypothetical protein
MKKELKRIKIELFGPKVNERLLPVKKGKRAGQDLQEKWMREIQKEAGFVFKAASGKWGRLV